MTRCARAIPQYTVGHVPRIAKIEGAEQAIPGLFFCSNSPGGISVADCMKSGHAMAEGVITQLLG